MKEPPLCMQAITAHMFSRMHDTTALAKTFVSLGNSLVTLCYKQLFVIAMCPRVCGRQPGDFHE